MIRISQLKLPVMHRPEELKEKAARLLRVRPEEIRSLRIVRQSLDARKKPDLFYVYSVDAEIPAEEKVLKKVKGNTITKTSDQKYRFPVPGTQKLKNRPVVVGCGPAGLFCAYELARNGYRPVLIEQGAPVEERMADVETFWKTGRLNPFSNVQFGEGGAGTFSDGKLNTLVKDPFGRGREVLRLFTEFGAPEEILYTNKPHIGTDLLTSVIRNMREAVKKAGGDVYFHTCMTEIDIKDGKVSGIIIRNNKTKEEKAVPVQVLVLAPGHSARNTFEMLSQKGVEMEAKAFAVGVRAEHPQEWINRSQYGNQPDEVLGKLGASAYKLAANLENGHGVYSFCMCPGGYVVNASSEEGRLAVNGMSYHDRTGKNANSAIVVTVSPEEYGDGSPLSGLSFQRSLEEKAWQAGQGKIPAERLADFEAHNPHPAFGDGQTVRPQMKGDCTCADVRGIFPDWIGASIVTGMHLFGKKIRGFDHPDTLLSGVESRTSSPVRIPRNAAMEHVTGGLYPCGEGAGYAGGITSAAMDGLKTAEAIVQKYAPFPESA